MKLLLSVFATVLALAMPAMASVAPTTTSPDTTEAISAAIDYAEVIFEVDVPEVVAEIGVSGVRATANATKAEVIDGLEGRIAGWFASVAVCGVWNIDDIAVKTFLDNRLANLNLLVGVFMDTLEAMADEIDVSGSTIASDLWNTDAQMVDMAAELDYIYEVHDLFGNNTEFCGALESYYPTTQMRTDYNGITQHYSYVVNFWLNPFSNNYPADYNEVWANEFDAPATAYNNHASYVIQGIVGLEQICGN